MLAIVISNIISQMSELLSLCDMLNQVSNKRTCYMIASKGLLWLADTGCNMILQILMFAKISCCLLKIAG